MRTDLRPAVTRRSFVSLAFLSHWRGVAPLQPQARMTIAEGWDALFRWCGLVPAGLPAAT